MERRVKVSCRYPLNIPGIIVPVRMGTANLNLTDEQIFAAICGKATVDEILADGSLKRLTLANYKDATEAAAPVVEPIVEPETITPVVEPTPVVEEEPVVEDVKEEVAAEEVVEDPAEEVKEETVEEKISNNNYNKKNNKR